MRKKEEALAFMIWRHANSVDWDCTIGELAKAVGKSYARTLAVLRARGWHKKVRSGFDEAQAARSMAVLNHARRSNVDLNMLDLVELVRTPDLRHAMYEE